ncbi:polyprenol monophosphomannose synthase [Reichenbachiella agarivorans]|uniref:Polyprenol monophosphomannose synthase n=1 Tax=Reichenbachiella agarivorans TaxID=2979464 RepID=A0ABY6CU60_9BACT|nr:polyprenol monophosphomannose synthase [Reichenbachiella agarivorans]UXP34056.1 polyprenol monophosphomannose synthase [Reichenbachiella agarivorans]
MNDSLVIIPTFNEKENIEAIINAVIDLGHGFDILIVDDGSPDGTADLVKAQQAKHTNIHLIQRKGKLGLGTAYITGFQFAIDHGYDFIFEMDADFSHNPTDLLALKKACKVDGYDMAVGSRYISGVNVVNWPMDRVLMSYCASKYVQFITGIPIKDTTAGFKCYRRNVLETIGLKNIHFVGYAFQIEMKFQAWKYNFKITEVPIIFTDRTLGQSKMSRGIFKEAVIGVVQMKIKSLFKKYIR